jgi:hypothetical protein
MKTKTEYKLKTQYRIIFKYIEPFLLIISFILFVINPTEVSKLLYKPFLFNPALNNEVFINNPITFLNIFYFFNMTMIMSFIQFYCIEVTLNQTSFFLAILLIGDITHLLGTYFFIFNDISLFESIKYFNFGLFLYIKKRSLYEYWNYNIFVYF